MNLFAYLSLASLIINVLLVGYILSKNPRGSTARVYLLLLGTFILWAVPEFIVRSFQLGDPGSLLLLIRVEWTGISFVPAIMAHFVLAYPRRSTFLDYSWSLLVLYTPSIVFTTFLWGGTLLVEGVVTGPLGPSAKVGALYLPLASLYAFIILIALAYLGKAYLLAEDPRSRRMTGLVLLGFSIPTVAGTVTEVFGPFLLAAGTRLGLGTTYTTLFLALVALAIFRYGFLVIEATPEAEIVRPRFGWQKGKNHLVLERGREGSFTAFRELVQEVPGLCVTAFPPQTLSARFDLHRTAFLWLSNQKGYEWSLKPIYLEVDVLHTVLKFMAENPGSAVLLDDLDYLAEVNGFKALLRTLMRVTAAASKQGCTLVATLSPGGVDESQLATVRGYFDEVRTVEDDLRGGPPSFEPPGSLLWEGDRDECMRRISRSPAKRKMVISTMYPEKLRTDFGLQDADLLWISPVEHGTVPSHDVSRLHYEILRDVVRGVAQDSLVYIGELEILVEETGFLETLEYAKRLVDLGATRESLVVASIKKGSLPAGQLALVEKRFAQVA